MAAKLQQAIFRFCIQKGNVNLFKLANVKTQFLVFRLAGLGDSIQTLWMLENTEEAQLVKAVFFTHHRQVLSSIKTSVQINYVNSIYELPILILKNWNKTIISFHTNFWLNFFLILSPVKCYSWTNCRSYKKRRLPYQQGVLRLTQIMQLLALAGLRFVEPVNRPLQFKTKNKDSIYDLLIIPGGGNKSQSLGSRAVSFELMKSIAKKYKNPVIIGLDSDKLVDEFKNFSTLPVELNLSSQAFCEYFQSAKMVVSGDTGLAHLAVATGTKITVFCGPTFGEQVFGKHPWLSIFQSQFLCSPCYQEKTAHRDLIQCCREPKCMRPQNFLL